MIAEVGTATPCQGGGINELAFNGSGNPMGGGTLVIDTAAGTYTFNVEAQSPGQSQEIVCGVPEPPGGGPEVWPLVGPSCNTPYTQPFTLPSSVGALTKTNITFSTGAVCPYLPATQWTLSFDLTPTLAAVSDNQDDHCNIRRASSIACQNQSLGEDVPLVGTGFFLHYESERSPGTSGANSVASADALSLGGWTLSAHHAYDPSTNTLFLGDGRQRSAWQFGSALVTLNGNTLFTSDDGSEVYVFDGTGHHFQTLRPLTGALEYQFGYDAAGKLITITDASGNVTTIQRDGSEHPTAIVSPFAQTSTLSVDGNGFISVVTDPAGNTVKFTNTTTGLLSARSDANGNVYNYSYDSNGKLTMDSDPAGGSTTLARTNSNSGYGVTTTTAMGRTSTYQVTTGLAGEQFTNTWPNGLQATMSNIQQNGQLSESMSLPDGTASSSTLGPDPRWGLQAPVASSGTQTLGNLSMTLTGSRAATLGTAGNPFTLVTQTDIAKVNGRTYTSVFTASTKTFLDTSPMKRKITTVLDSLERISSAQQGTLLPLKFAYDTNGRLSTVTQGTRVTTLAYDSNSFLAGATDPLNLTTSFTHDAAGRLLTTTLPDGRVTTYTYDRNGNVASITPPGKPVHDMAYTAVDVLSTYTPPPVSGTGTTSYAYNADRDLTTITRPDGQTIQFGYDSAGRLSSTTIPTETINYSYDAITGNPTSESISGGEALDYGYNGPLLTSAALTGSVAGTVSRTYNNNFWIASESINGANTTNFTYDNDGAVTKAGSLIVKSNSNSLVTGTTLGSATDSFAYDTFGEVTGYTAKYGTAVLYSEKYTRDADGRITAKTETIGGKKNTYTYTYDKAGRLTAVKENAATVSTYTYDTNSNRVTAMTSSGTVSGTYDAQDRLLTYSSTSYTYRANGELASQTAASQTTTYNYDALGNLIASTLPNGTKIQYIVDSEEHRVGKQVNGALVNGFLYDGDRVVAQLDGTNAIVSQFIYGNGATADYMVAGGVTYRIFSDQLGSPRLVVNTSTGGIAERIDYDEFGNVINDTDPGFQPFGFAGGLYDQDTKLVRFGARDYNPVVGRWTAKDLILFAGGDTNLYSYVLADPVNLIDPTGLCSLKEGLGKIVSKVGKSLIPDEVKVPFTPLSISPDKQEISVGVSAGVEAGGQTVAEATATAAVGVNSPEHVGAPLTGPLFHWRLTAKLILARFFDIEILDERGDFGDPTKGPITPMLDPDKRNGDLMKQAICSDPDACQNSK
jgi:RHS repeat-associated protein